jgi:2-oxoglutarate dehydrogenase complex dehydrogenase (E1) component-like enzyme
VTSLESSGLNAGFVGQLLEQYLENPEAVDPAWRAVFERGDVDVLSALPGLERLVGDRARGDGNGFQAVTEGPATALAEPAASPAAAPAS